MGDNANQQKKAPMGNEDRTFVAVIGDEDSVTGLLLAGVGEVNQEDQSRNFAVVSASTDREVVEKAFDEYTQNRQDIAVVLINQYIADKIRHRMDTYTQAFPAVLEIPSKDHPYDPEKDSVLRRVNRLFGE